MTEISAKVAVLDDETDMLENCRRLLSRWGHKPICFSDPMKAEEIVDSERPDIFITDIRMPGRSGLDVLTSLRERAPQMPVIVFTAFASVESAIEAIKAGAFDYIVKPFTLDGFKIVLDRAVESQRLRSENENLKRQVASAFGADNIIGQSEPMVKLGEMIRKVARSTANVLIHGESGTGKELVARCVHANSDRAARPIVPVDCASIPETLLESELFGYQKGAFTGAVQNRAGLFETAEGGTLFFDEIGEMPLGLQAKMLRVLQERTFRRLGGNDLRHADVRVLAATNRDLDAERKAGRFREDLYFRLGVITISVPPLRERTGDVELLANHFAKRFAKQSGLPFAKISRQAIGLLESYVWPGNVRELQNVMERAITLSSGEVIVPDDLPGHISGNDGSQPAAVPDEDSFKAAKERCVENFEKNYLRAILENCRYNITKVARVSGLNRRTIYRLMERYGFRQPD
ncbi:MAG: sigma-54 dependent transcriptional regulator [Candidatus Sumerlaeaceae bacterium]|nr:sigma-54 dependent transcriptional regulator [Candidatus Sumerlaeaceae bacterium]